MQKCIRAHMSSSVRATRPIAMPKTISITAMAERHTLTVVFFLFFFLLQNALSAFRFISSSTGHFANAKIFYSVYMCVCECGCVLLVDESYRLRIKVQDKSNLNHSVWMHFFFVCLCVYVFWQCYLPIVVSGMEVSGPNCFSNMLKGVRGTYPHPPPSILAV